jgi:hypothetical protein
MQNNTIIYQEKTTMKLWAFITIPLLLVVILLDILLNESPKINGSSDSLWTIAIPVVVFLLLYFIKLEWKFTENAFQFRFFPFIVNEKIIPYSEIQHISVIKINPLLEFGGWGLRRGKLGKAYTTQGNLIIHIELKSGQKLNFSVKDKVSTENAIKKTGISSQIEKTN